MADEQHQKKRYESDLTRKEKRELEREKLKSMGWKGRFQYIWEYYKPQMAGILAVIVAIVAIVQWVDNLKNEDIFYLAVVNSSQLDGESLAADFKTYLGDEDPYHMVSVDTSLAMYEETGSEYATQVKMMALIAAGSLDMMVCPQDVYDQYKGQEAFLDLKEVLDDELWQELSDYIDGDKLILDDCAKWQEFGMTSYEPAYLTVISSGKNRENTVKFIEYLFQ